MSENMTPPPDLILLGVAAETLEGLGYPKMAREVERAASHLRGVGDDLAPAHCRLCDDEPHSEHEHLPVEMQALGEKP